MIEKIKTITYEVRSHGQKTILSDKGLIDIHKSKWIDIITASRDFNRTRVKKMIWHLEDVLKCMNTIRKEEAEKKKKQNESS